MKEAQRNIGAEIDYLTEVCGLAPVQALVVVSGETIERREELLKGMLIGNVWTQN